MTTVDFDKEFDLLYNNALGTSAPEINKYEKSLFLTQAQEILVKSLYEDLKRNLSVERSEKIRRRLEPLTTQGVSTYDSTLNSALEAIKIGSNSKFFAINNNVWYIIGEQVFTSTTDLYVDPVTNDEYMVQKGNPFKEPNTRRVWRLDIFNTVNSTRVVEIITTQTLTKYIYRYITKPTPIILTDISTGIYSGMGLSIDGITAETECTLRSEMHRDILVKAVEIATLAYKENTLANNVQLDQNNNF